MSDTHQQNLKMGIITALGAAFFLTTMNIITKILVEDLDPIVVGFWRNLFAFILLTVVFFVTKTTYLMRTTRLKDHVVRGIVGTVGLVLAIWMFSLMPVTEGTIIGFTSPLFVIMLSYPLLQEKVGKYRIIATMFGLLGIVWMVGFDQSGLNTHGLMVGLGFAFSNALVLIMLRQLGKTEHAMTTVFYFMGIGLVMMALYLPFASKILPEFSAWYLVLGLGVFGLVSLILKTESYRHAPATVIAPIAYTMLLWSAFFDYIIWNHVASANIWIGAGIIIASNIIILWREHHKSKTEQIPLA
jgi:drug/metabolite transporter (DMT)-like permease